MLGQIEPNGVALALFAATFAACCLSFFTLTGMFPARQTFHCACGEALICRRA